MKGPQVRHGTDMRIYNQHLLNLKNVSAKTDNKAPRLPVGVYVKEATFFADISRLRNVERQNRNLLKDINFIYRTKGKVDCQLEKYDRKKTMYLSNQEILEKQRKKIDEFLKKLKFMKSTYNHEDMLEDWKKALKVMKCSAKYPEFYEKKQSSSDTWSICPKRVKSDPKSHQVCFLDLKIGDLPKTFRLKIELYGDVVPGTAANFASLCEGYSGLTYRDSVFHRIVPGLLCLGGDIVNHSGTGGISIYGPSFQDENFTLRHNGPGVVAMYTTEPDKNNSQFLITFRKLSTLDGKYVVIGRVKSNLKILQLTAEMRCIGQDTNHWTTPKVQVAFKVSLITNR